jgi:hypothetical protein
MVRINSGTNFSASQQLPSSPAQLSSASPLSQTSSLSISNLSTAKEAKHQPSCFYVFFETVWNTMVHFFRTLFCCQIPVTEPLPYPPKSDQNTTASLNSKAVPPDEMIPRVKIISFTMPFQLIRYFPPFKQLCDQQYQLEIKILDIESQVVEGRHLINYTNNKVLIDQYRLCNDQIKLILELNTEINLKFMIRFIEIETNHIRQKALAAEDEISCSFESQDKNILLYEEKIALITQILSNIPIDQQLARSQFSELKDLFNQIELEQERLQTIISPKK